MGMKQRYKALDHVIIALAALKEGDAEAAADAMEDALESDDLGDAIEDLEESQAADGEESDELDDDLEVSSYLRALRLPRAECSKVLRKAGVKKAVANAAMALAGEGCDDEAEELLSEEVSEDELEELLPEPESEEASDEEDEMDLEEEEEVEVSSRRQRIARSRKQPAQKSLASVLKDRAKQVRHNLKNL